MTHPPLPAGQFHLQAWIVSKEDLILSKLVWARPSASELQLRDVQALLASGADEAYLRRPSSGSPISGSIASMQDTTPEFRRLVAARLRLMAPEERVRRCAEMFETARHLIEASLPVGLDPLERRKRLGERLYGEFARRAFAASADGGR